MTTNIELMRRAFEAWNTRDLEAFIAYCDPRIEFHSAFAAVDAPAVFGHGGVREQYRRLEHAWGDAIRGELEALFDLGEHVVAFYVLHGRGRQSGVEVAMPLAMVVRWHEGRVTYFKAYTRREDALSDLGVSEDQLEPIVP